MWIDTHPFGTFVGVYPIEGGKVITARASRGVDNVQVWDVTDPDWGRSITIEHPANDGSTDRRRWHLGNGLMAYPVATDDEENEGIIVYDLLADDPTTSVTQITLGGRSSAAQLGSSQIGIAIPPASSGIQPGETSQVQVWDIGAQEPTHTIEVDGRVNYFTGDGNDTLYYISKGPDELWQWTPPAAPEPVGRPPGPDSIYMTVSLLQVAPSGRLVVGYGSFIDVFDPSNGQTTTLTGIDAGLETRFQPLAISELPDGRIVGHYPAGETAYWDVAQPDNPTITVAEDPREWTGASALETGEVLQAWLISGPESVDYEIVDAIELVAPPAP